MVVPTNPWLVRGFQRDDDHTCTGILGISQLSSRALQDHRQQTRPNMANRGYDVVVDVDAEVSPSLSHLLRVQTDQQLTG